MYSLKNHTNRLCTPILFVLFLFSCSSKNKDFEINHIASEYYKTYQINKDFDKFMDFYSEEIELEDIINGDKIIGKDNLRKFFNWNNPELVRSESLALKIEHQVTNKNVVVTKGYFNSFKWKDLKVEAMHFTSILYFNESKKIIKQVDWINYPSSLVDYKNRKNSNKWILNN